MFCFLCILFSTASTHDDLEGLVRSAGEHPASFLVLANLLRLDGVIKTRALMLEGHGDAVTPGSGNSPSSSTSSRVSQPLCYKDPPKLPFSTSAAAVSIKNDVNNDSFDRPSSADTSVASTADVDPDTAAAAAAVSIRDSYTARLAAADAETVTRTRIVTVIAAGLSKSSAPLVKKASLTRDDFFHRMADETNISKRLDSTVRDKDLEGVVQYLNKIGFTQKVLEGLLEEYSYTLSAELLEALLKKYGSHILTDRSLMALWKGYGRNLHGLPSEVLTQVLRIVLEKYTDVLSEDQMTALKESLVSASDTHNDDNLDKSLYFRMYFDQIKGMVDVSVHDSGCQDRALAFDDIFKKHEWDFLINWRKLSALPLHTKLFVALSILAERHGSVRYGRDSFSSWHMPERAPRLRQWEIFPRLEPTGTLIDPGQPAAFLTSVYTLLSWMTKTLVYPLFERESFTRPVMYPSIPVFKHGCSLDNLFKRKLPCVLRLIHFCPVGVEEGCRVVPIKAIQACYPVDNLESRLMKDDSLKIVVEVCTYNLNPTQQDLISGSLCDEQVLQSMLMAWARKTDGEPDISGTHNIAGIKLETTGGMFGRKLMGEVVLHGKPTIGARHIYLSYGDIANKQPTQEKTDIVVLPKKKIDRCVS